MVAHRPLALAVLALAGATLTAVGCASPAPGSVTGTVKGTTLGVNDTVSGVYASNGSTLAVIAITTEPGACANFTNGVSIADATSVLLSLGRITSGTVKTTAPTAVGTFNVWDSAKSLLPPSNSVAVISWYQSDDACKSTLQATGVSGTVTLTAVDNGAYSGTGTVTFDSGDTVSFTFDATNCSAITTAQSGLSTANCM